MNIGFFRNRVAAAAPLAKQCLSVSIRVLVISCILAASLVSGPLAHGGNVTLGWDASTSGGVAGYRVHLGNVSRSYTNSVDVGTSLGCEFRDLDDTLTYYFAVTAYDGDKIESSFSGEIVYPARTIGSQTSSATGGGGGGGCFIATAVYGPSSREVSILRRFRDDHLLTNTPGRAFVRFYYAHSPAIARLIGSHLYLRTVGRCLLEPVVFVVSHTIAAWCVLVAGFATVLASVWPRRRRWYCRRSVTSENRT
jgi:hypothetical protein